MLTEICAYLRNYFDRNSRGELLPSWTEEITISGGELVGFTDRLLPGQFYRIIDSVLNDGVYRFGTDVLADETFSGTVQSMAVPQEIVLLDGEIASWIENNADALNSPYQSESFGGYSYSLRSGSSGGGDSGANTGGLSWQSQFAARLAPWRKI